MSMYCVDIHGNHQTQTSVASRAFHYADGCFTTIRVRNSQLQLWQQHTDRLLSAAQALFFNICIHSISHRAQLIAQQIQQGVLKIHVSRVPSHARGYATDTAGPDETQVLFYYTALDPKASYKVLAIQKEIHVACVDMQLAPVSTKLSGLKTLARTEQVLAGKLLQFTNQESEQQYAEALLCDGHNNLVEGISSNVFVQFADETDWHTPCLEQCGVAGTLRAFILAANPYVHISKIPAQRLATVQSMFLTNAVKGITPVKSIQLHDGTTHNLATDAVHRVHENMQLKMMRNESV